MRLYPWLAASAIVATSGCIDVTTDVRGVPVYVDPDYTVASAALVSYESTLLWSTTDALFDPFYEPLAVRAGADASEVDPIRAAEAAAAAAERYFEPAGCVTTALSGAKVTYTFDDCAGPLGHGVTIGRLHATFSEASGALRVAVSSSGLDVSGSAVSIDATATYERSGQQKSLRVVSSSNITPPSGRVTTRELEYTIAWPADSLCLDIEGGGSLTTLGVTYRLALRHFTQCQGQCTKSAAVRLSGTDGTVELSYDGTATARFVDLDGDSLPVAIECVPTQ